MYNQGPPQGGMGNYQAPPGYQPPMGYQQPMGGMGMGPPMVDSSSGGTTVFVFGILGFVLCQLFAPIAWVKGNEYMRTCAAMGVQPSGLGVAGRILGIIGSVLGLISIVFVAIMMLASIAAH